MAGLIPLCLFLIGNIYYGDFLSSLENLWHSKDTIKYECRTKIQNISVN